ncbi:MAG: hypothetical protein ABUL62_15970 [Myxococcales bacterium]
MTLARLTAALPVLLVACRPELDDHDWLIDSVRVLAVKGEPAEARPGEPVRFTAFLSTTDNPANAQDLAWQFCSAPKPTTENNVVSSACLNGANALHPAGRGSTIEVSTPLDGCALFGPDTPPADFRPRDPDATGGCYQPLRVDLPGAVPTVHLQRISCGLSEASAGTASAFSMAYSPNQNPTLAPLVARASGRLVELTQIAPAESLDLELSWPAEAAEFYAYYERTTQQITVRRESLRVAWYVDGGKLDTEATGRAEEDLQLVTNNRWSAPERSGVYHLWLVLRDSRGGVDFARYELSVAP